MSTQGEITRISGNVTNSLAEVAAKGVPVPSGANSDNLPGLIRLISGGGGGTQTGGAVGGIAAEFIVIPSVTIPLREDNTGRGRIGGITATT